MHSTLKEIIRQECKKRGITLYRLAKELGIDYSYLFAVVSLLKVSRPVIFKLAEYFHAPDLLFEYEKILRSKSVENKAKNPPKIKEVEP
ncbi:helix-turn-helix transcriptional regulator [Hydrogenobacter thermophilus]|uniref:helix-turn-helix transcriptional regulator n=1 Tax=Hydrogenobacter thermophilus TaxID=940 RepID=UPI0030F6AFF3